MVEQPEQPESPKLTHRHEAAWLRRLVRSAAQSLPGPLATAGAVVTGLAVSGFLGKHRAIVRSNLRRVLGRRSALREAVEVAETFTNFAQCLVESLAHQPGEVTQAHCEVQGEEHLTRALARGRGVIVVTAHAGAWDVAARQLSSVTSRPVMVVMAREPNVDARRMHDELRRAYGIEVVHVGEDALEGLSLLRHLRGDGIVAVQIDRVSKGSRALTVDLFGHPFSMPQGPFSLCSLTGASLVPVFVARRGRGDYLVCVHPEVTLPRRAEAPLLTAAAQQVAVSLAAFLRHYPTQWFHFEPW